MYSSRYTTYMRPKGSAEELERRRQRALSLLKEGYSQTKVGRLVGASQASVSRWQKAAEKNGGAVPAKRHLGCPRRLTSLAGFASPSAFTRRRTMSVFRELVVDGSTSSTPDEESPHR